MELIGHRGCGAQSDYPENTVRAVSEAATHLPAVEVDVRRCGSGELVVHHDETLVGQERGQFRVDETAYETLRAIDIGSGTDEIPRLADVLAVVPPSVTVQVELKETGLARDVLDTIVETHRNVRVSSFSETALAEFAALDSDVPTGYLFRDDTRKNLDVAAGVGCEIVHPHHELCVETPVVRRARKRGFDVIAWNTDDPTVVAAVAEANVDGITVDRWDIGQSRTVTGNPSVR